MLRQKVILPTSGRSRHASKWACSLGSLRAYPVGLLLISSPFVLLILLVNIFRRGPFAKLDWYKNNTDLRAITADSLDLPTTQRPLPTSVHPLPPSQLLPYVTMSPDNTYPNVPYLPAQHSTSPIIPLTRTGPCTVLSE